MNEQKSVVIDKDILGWADEKISELSKEYKNILKVGTNESLPQRSFDEDIAKYCKENNHDLITGDARAYVRFFRVGVKRVSISQHDWWAKADKPIFLVSIEE